MNNAVLGQRTLLGFDFGTKSIGIAVGQEITGTARPLTAFKANDGIHVPGHAFKHFGAICEHGS